MYRNPDPCLGLANFGPPGGLAKLNLALLSGWARLAYLARLPGSPSPAKADKPKLAKSCIAQPTDAGQVWPALATLGLALSRQARLS